MDNSVIITIVICITIIIICLLNKKEKREQTEKEDQCDPWKALIPFEKYPEIGNHSIYQAKRLYYGK